MKIPRSAKITLWATRAIAAVLVLLVFLMPRIVEWYSEVRTVGFPAAIATLAAFYVCCIPVSHALWQLDRLLAAIAGGNVFCARTVQRIKALRWDCLAVCLICLPAAFYYPPLIFVVVIMAFLSLVVSVLSGVMAAAVQIREENDLTI